VFVTEGTVLFAASVITRSPELLGAALAYGGPDRAGQRPAPGGTAATSSSRGS